jgi:protein TonB
LGLAPQELETTTGTPQPKYISDQQPAGKSYPGGFLFPVEVTAVTAKRWEIAASFDVDIPNHTSFSSLLLLTLRMAEGENTQADPMPHLNGKHDSGENSKHKTPPLFVKRAFGEGLRENFREIFRPNLRGESISAFSANSGLRFDGFWRNLRDLISRPKLSPLESTCQPIVVKDIWSKNAQFTRMQFSSVSLHVLALALLVIFATPRKPVTKLPNPPLNGVLVPISRFLPDLTRDHGQPNRGGGGERDPLQAGKGRAPIFAQIQLAPPRVRAVEDAKLLVPPSIIEDSRIVMPSKMPNWGNPSMLLVNASSGPGDGDGIGSNGRGGVGDLDGDGSSGNCDASDGIPCAGSAGYTMPTCLYCPRVEYSDEAVKAKYEGNILLLAVITPDGRATDIHISKGLDLGLNEKAIEAVRGWRFKPALGPDRRPTAVRVPIEVTFHLY